MSIKNEVVGGDEATKKSLICTLFWANKVKYYNINYLCFKYQFSKRINHYLQ